jgi:hypothetical protein
VSKVETKVLEKGRNEMDVLLIMIALSMDPQSARTFEFSSMENCVAARVEIFEQYSNLVKIELSDIDPKTRSRALIKAIGIGNVPVMACVKR